MRLDTRVKMIRAMDFIARQLNDEDIFFKWLTIGVADEDCNNDDEYIANVYCDDETFSDIMGCFVTVMRDAYRSGGLFCDNVVSNEGAH